jgi:pyridoxamine 5'-phosphate oxidase family protein
MANSAKYRNVRSNPHVAFVVDEVTAPTMEGAHFLEIRGVAQTTVGAHAPTGHLAAEIIRIHPRRVISFNVDPDHPGLAARDTEPAD